jgi:hypothetical protein
VKRSVRRETVDFITTEDGDDLIVAFALADEEPGEVVTLTLLRTPKYEALLPDEERGVSVSHEREVDEDDDYLRRVSLVGSVMTIESTRRRYQLEMSQVDQDELLAARRILARMNFDGRFVLDV